MTGIGIRSNFNDEFIFDPWSGSEQQSSPFGDFVLWLAKPEVTLYTLMGPQRIATKWGPPTASYLVPLLIGGTLLAAGAFVVSGEIYKRLR